MFNKSRMPGDLVPISGSDPSRGPWEHVAFAAHPLPVDEPSLSGGTYRQVARARASLAALDSTARRLRNPSLFRRPTLDREAQSTSALEGTYAPLSEVLTEDEQAPATLTLREIFNYVSMANQAFEWITEGRPLTTGMLTDLQGVLVRGTPSEARFPGQIRGEQVVIGRRPEARNDEFPVRAARFIPAPPGLDLKTRMRALVTWINEDPRGAIDPLVAAAMAHYQFETLHPFHDGNGRVGRLLIVVQLVISGVLTEPTLSVSPWFEARRADYFDRLLGVSAKADWDSWINFFAQGLDASAVATHTQMLSLLDVQETLHERLRSSRLRSDKAHTLVDLAVARPSFTARQVERELEISYARANGMISQLVELELLAPVHRSATYGRRFYAPSVLEVLLDP